MVVSVDDHRVRRIGGENRPMDTPPSVVSPPVKAERGMWPGHLPLYLILCFHHLPFLCIYEPTSSQGLCHILKQNMHFVGVA